MNKNSKSAQLEERVGRSIATLQAQLLAGSSGAKATLALLRQSYAQPFGTVSGLWDLENGCLPDAVRNSKYFGETPEVDSCEHAVHATLCAYAFHQRGNQSGAHRRREGMQGTFGAAVRQFAYKQREDGKMPDAFRMMIMAQDFQTLFDNLCRVSRLLASSSVSYDYGQLASDLFFWQLPKHRDSVIRKWGRQWASTYRGDFATTDENDD